MPPDNIGLRLFHDIVPAFKNDVSQTFSPHMSFPIGSFERESEDLVTLTSEVQSFQEINGCSSDDESPDGGDKIEGLVASNSQLVVESDVLAQTTNTEDALFFVGSHQDTSTPKSELVVELPQSTLNTPRSHFEGFIPPAPVSAEWRAVNALLEHVKEQGLDSEDFIEFELNDFTVYVDAVRFPHELRPLQSLGIRPGSDTFYFDGILSYGATQFYLQRIPFRELPIGNYGLGELTVGDQIWIRSDFNQSKEVYYQLGRPAVEYERFHAPFRWIADLAKHVIDYCSDLNDSGRKRATLYDFKTRFSKFLLRTHKKSHPDYAIFEKWHSAHKDGDFRGAIVAHIDFIWKEAVGVLGRSAAARHPFWKEIKGDFYKPNLGHMVINPSDDDDEREESQTPSSRPVGGPEKVPQTIVTPYMNDLFSHLEFGKIMKAEEPTKDVRERQVQMIQDTGLKQAPFKRPVKHGATRNCLIASIRPGDVISTPPDDPNITDTRWKSEVSDHHDSNQNWYGLVQQVHQSKKGRSFDVTWLYHPRDTPCALMKYPWANELFLSDSCTCGGSRVTEDQVISVHEVEWFGEPSSVAEFFVRQTYFSDDHCWKSLKSEHMICEHNGSGQKHQTAGDEYRPGDTVLVNVGQQELLQPFEVEAIFIKDQQQCARLRKLLRRREADPHARSCAPNELVYTEQRVEMSTASIVRRCLVRIFKVKEDILPPYDRGGTGDAFFITHREVSYGSDGPTKYIPIYDNGYSPSLRQGFDPSSVPKSQKLRGLGLYVGGGNFDRGLEEGGAIEMNWANDIMSEAIHTYMANSKPGSCKPYLGSVDDLFHQALMGSTHVPLPGDVDFISGGSPCQGFSRLTKDKTTDQQQKNQSLIASFASFIDFYRPRYGLLENVSAIVRGGNHRQQCPFSQLVCAIVGLGYQVQIIWLDAWSFGSSQRRNRIFIGFAAPGVKMFKPPAPTHSHPPTERMGRVGLMSNGEGFGERTNAKTPFKFVSASEAADDLPSIEDGKADCCVGFPDHRLSIGYTPPLRKQLFQIPIQPYGMSYSKSWFGYTDRNGRLVNSVMSKADRDHYFLDPRLGRMQSNSHGWGRIDPTGLFPTITTKCLMTDARVGYINHWNQHRPLSILETRRAQGFLDRELILGTPPLQWRIVGNSVARPVALALGLAICEAWFESLYDDEQQMGHVASQHIQDIKDLPGLPPQSSLEEPTTTNPRIEVEMMGFTETSSSGSSTDPPSQVDTPKSTQVSTPRTSVDGFDELLAPRNVRKRSLAPICVELPAKKPKSPDIIDLALEDE